MTIGFDGSRAFVDYRTGTENYSYQILRHLSQIDHTNQYIVYLRPGQNPNVIASRLQAARQSGAEIASSSRSIGTPRNDDHGWPPNFQFKTINYPRLWTQVGLAIQTWQDPIDVLFVTAHTLPIVHRPGLKTVMVAHDLGAEYLPGMHQLKQRLYLNFITNYQFKSATRVIAVSKATKQDLITKAGVSPSQIDVIYEGIDTQFLTPPKHTETTKTLKKFDLIEQSYFFFLGTIQPRKNLVNLITSFGDFCTQNPDKKYKLVIAGSKGWLSDQIFALPQKLGIRQSVVFTGRISDDEAKHLYSSAIAFTYPSLFEGFGLPILEAFAMDCPVLTSNTSSMPEVAGDAAILVDPTSVDQIAHGLAQISDSKLRRELVAKGKKQLQKFSWSEAAQQTLNVLESL